MLHETVLRGYGFPAMMTFVFVIAVTRGSAHLVNSSSQTDGSDSRGLRVMMEACLLALLSCVDHLAVARAGDGSRDASRAELGCAARSSPWHG